MSTQVPQVRVGMHDGICFWVGAQRFCTTNCSSSSGPRTTNNSTVPYCNVLLMGSHSPKGRNAATGYATHPLEQITGAGTLPPQTASQT